MMLTEQDGGATQATQIVEDEGINFVTRWGRNR